MISWAFFDLGGTLLDDSGLVDAITRTYVERLNARGYSVSLDEFAAVRDVMIVRQEQPLYRAAATAFTRNPAIAEEIWADVKPRILGAEVDGQRAFPETLAFSRRPPATQGSG